MILLHQLYVKQIIIHYLNYAYCNLLCQEHSVGPKKALKIFTAKLEEWAERNEGHNVSSNLN
jgi:hypothetical protein